MLANGTSAGISVLNGSLTIETVATVKESLVTQVVTRQPQDKIDLSKIDACDAAGLQLLVATAKTLAAMGKTLAIQAASEPLKATAAELGLPLDQLVGKASENQALSLASEGVGRA